MKDWWRGKTQTQTTPMKTPFHSRTNRFTSTFSRLLVVLAVGLSGIAAWGGGVTFELHPQRENHSYGPSYSFYPDFFTNSLPTNAPLGMYFITSPQQPTNGSSRQMELTTNGFNFVTGGSGSYPNFDALMYGITNGLWTLRVTNTTSTNVYRFSVSGSGMTSNMFPTVLVTFPVEGQGNVTNHPNFTWQGPASWPGTVIMYDYKFNQMTFNFDFFSYNFPQPSTATTNWLLTDTAPPGQNTFYIQYTNDATAVLPATVPVNTNTLAAFPGWVYRCQLDNYMSVNFNVANPATGGNGTTGHTNVAYYTFEDNSLFAHDYSGKGNNINVYGNSPQITGDALDGSYAFFPGGTGWLYPPTNSLLGVFAGSFSVSLWLKTSDVHGNDNDFVYSAAGIVSTFSGPGQNTSMPMGLTGSKLGFYTGGSTSDMLHSMASINTGSYVHVVVTRNQLTGEKKIYINGALDNSSTGTTESLNDSEEIVLGVNNGAGFNGKMDEVQFYSGVLSASEVTQLYNNPGTTIPDVAGGAANGLVAHYDFNGGTALASDVSGNGNDLTIAGDFGGSGPSTNSQHIGSSGGSLSFDGGSYISAPTTLLSTIAGSFSISLWVKTTQDNGNPDDVAWTGDAIIAADSPYAGDNDLIPLALTGGQAAFNTANTEFDYDDTINSSAYVSDGSWHHIVVTRNQPTGEKTIYIDGEYDISDTDATNLLNDPKILTFGCKADASDPDQESPSFTGENGYDGLVDDIQIYNRALTPTEVAYLYAHPGETLSTTTTNTPYPVSADVQFNVSRIQDNGNEYYVGNVSFNSVSPAPTTTNAIYSPHSLWNTKTYPSGGSGSSTYMTSLADVVNEFTNGVWKMYINQGSPTQQVYSFQGSAIGITSNWIPPIQVFSPTNGAVNVVTNPVFRWSGPSNFNTLVVDLLSGPAIFPAPTTTNWASAPTLNYGPDRFDLSYTSNNVVNFTFTTPTEDTTAIPVESWGYSETISSTAFTFFTVGAPAPLPVQLVNAQPTNSAIRFSFQTLGGRPHTIQARTNLTLGSWVDLTNFTGDGSLQQFTFPVTNPPIRFFRVRTQ